jgi:ribosomal protein S27AE
MKDGTCPKCSTTTIIPDMKIPEYGHANMEQPLTVKLLERPNKLFNRGKHIHILRAWLCGTCGYTELYVDDPQRLYEAYQEAQQRQQQ